MDSTAILGEIGREVKVFVVFRSVQGPGAGCGENGEMCGQACPERHSMRTAR